MTLGKDARLALKPRGPIVVIVNPRAGQGRTARRWAALRPHLESVLGAVQIRETRAPQHATALTRSAIRAGSKTVIAVGGDGTANEVVNGFFDGEVAIAADTVLGLIPQGTASDFRRALSIPLDEKAALEIICKARVKRIDVERVSFQTVEGTRAQRYGVNITSFGMGGAVAARTNRSSKILGGKLSFLLATAITTIQFRGHTVTLGLEGQAPREMNISNVAVGNGQFHGGGMWMCPRAAVDDGLLDVTVIRYLSAGEILRSLSFLYNGKVYEHPKVEFHRVARLRATAKEPSWIEIDGEPAGRLPVEISVLPRAIGVYAPEE